MSSTSDGQIPNSPSMSHDSAEADVSTTRMKQATVSHLASLGLQGIVFAENLARDDTNTAQTTQVPQQGQSLKRSHSAPAVSTKRMAVEGRNSSPSVAIRDQVVPSRPQRFLNINISLPSGSSNETDQSAETSICIAVPESSGTARRNNVVITIDTTHEIEPVSTGHLPAALTTIRVTHHRRLQITVGPSRGDTTQHQTVERDSTDVPHQAMHEKATPRPVNSSTSNSGRVIASAGLIPTLQQRPVPEVFKKSGFGIASFQENSVQPSALWPAESPVLDCFKGRAIQSSSEIGPAVHPVNDSTLSCFGSRGVEPLKSEPMTGLSSAGLFSKWKESVFVAKPAKVPETPAQAPNVYSRKARDVKVAKKCWVCDSEDHLQRHCPSRRGNRR